MKRILCAALVCGCCVASAGQFRVGTRFILDLSSTWNEYQDSTGKVIGKLVTDDAYCGLGLTAEYAPLSWLTVRATAAETRLLTQGGFAVVLFPALGGDVVVEPPVKWRVLPHARFGGTYARCWGITDSLDPRMICPSEYSLRLGFGVRYRLNDRLSIMADTDIWGERMEVGANQYFFWQTLTSWIGIDQAHIGVTYAVAGY